MTEHTKTTWAVDKGQKCYVIHATEKPYDVAVVRGVGDEDDEANARHIVRCVNFHERLVEALDKAIGCMLVGINDFSIEDKEVYENACSLLTALEQTHDH